MPSWRGDIEGEADLVEEVLRINGYDHIPVVPMSLETALPRPSLDPAQRRAGLVRRTLAERGLRRGCVALCIGGGEAVAMTVER